MKITLINEIINVSYALVYYTLMQHCNRIFIFNKRLLYKTRDVTKLV